MHPIYSKLIGDSSVLLHVLFALFLGLQIVGDTHVLFQDLQFLLVHLPLLYLLVLPRVVSAELFSLLFQHQISCLILVVFLNCLGGLSLLFEDGIGPVFPICLFVSQAFRGRKPFLLLLRVPILLFLELGLLVLGQLLLSLAELMDE